jgi:chromosome segregation protein
LSVRELERIDKDIEEVENTILLNQGECEHFDREIEELEKAVAEIFEVRGNFVAETEKLRRQGESATADSAQADKEIAVMENEIIHNKMSSDILHSRIEEKNTELTQQIKDSAAILAEQAEKKQNLQAKRVLLKTALEELGGEKSENENKLAGYSRLYESKAAKRDETWNILEDIKREHNKKKTRFDVLSGIERAMEGYYPSVKAVLSEAKTGRFGQGGIHGTVADIITTDKEYSTAVEIALGSALQHIIVANEGIAKRCISFLKESRAGRATFLPLTTISGTTLWDSPGKTGTPIDSLLEEDGFIGIGHEIVKFDERFSGIVKQLLGRIVFAEDIDCAAIIAKKYNYKFKIVTLDGQVINSGGSFTGGSIGKSTGIISRKQELEDLQEQLKHLTEALEPAKAKHDQLAAECAKMKLECEGFSENIAKINGEEMRVAAEIEGVGNLLLQFDEQIENAETALARYKEKIVEERNKLSLEITELEQKNTALETAISEKHEQIKQINTFADENKEEIAALIQKSSEFEKRAIQTQSEIREKIGNKEKFSAALAAAIERKSAFISKGEGIKAALFDDYELTPSEALRVCADAPVFDGNLSDGRGD